jgi:DNA repair protein RadD
MPKQMTFQLRQYQKEAVDALFQAIKTKEPAPVICLPTGAGKSPVIADVCKRVVGWNRRVLVLAHVKELVSQLSESIKKHWGEIGAPVGVLSAGLGSKTIDIVTVAGIQSAYRRACDIGKIDLVLVDECHMIPASGQGMYQTLLKELRTINPALVLAGLTATPYRLQSGLICESQDDAPPMFSKIVYTAEVRDLIDQGFLSNLRAKNGGAPNLENVHKRGWDFIAEELQAELGQEEKVKAAVDEIMRHGSDRKAWLVFCCGVEHAQMVHSEISSRGISSAIVTGDTDSDERDETTALFKGKGLRCIVNVNVLTTGFDARHVDLIVLLRPTCSPGLYYQMVGRGLRIEDGKDDCLILDLAGNIERHGPIDKLNEKITSKKKAGKGEAPTRTCPTCEEVLFAGVRLCPVCGYEFPRETARHETIASDLSPLSGQEVVSVEEIDGVDCSVWEKRGAPEAPKTLRVDYYCGFIRVASEWICLDHVGFAFKKATEWMQERIQDGWVLSVVPDVERGQIAVLNDEEGNVHKVTVEHIAEIAHKCFIRPKAIKTVPDGKYKKIKGYLFDEQLTKSEQPLVAVACDDDDQPPF